MTVTLHATTLCCFPVLTNVVRQVFLPQSVGRLLILEHACPCFSALVFPILRPIFSSLLPLLNLVLARGWREAQAGRSFNCIMQPCNRSQSFRKFDKLEYVFRFLNSETFQRKEDQAVSSRWLQMVLLFCVR